MSSSRRRFLRLAAAASAGTLASGALGTLFARAVRAQDAEPALDAADAGLEPWRAPGYGPLVRDPDGLIDLPDGFRYRAFSMAALNSTEDPRFSTKLPN